MTFVSCIRLGWEDSGNPQWREQAAGLAPQSVCGSATGSNEKSSKRGEGGEGPNEVRHGEHCEHGALAVVFRMPKQALGGDKSFKLMAAHPTDALLWGNTSSARPSHLCSSLPR